MREFEETKKIVVALLQKEERCRNDDRWLIFRFMEHRGVDIKIDDDTMKINIPLDKFCDIPNFETIRRVRAEIQNDDGKLLPTDPKVLIKRRIREGLIREYYSNNKQMIYDWEGEAFAPR